MNKGKGFLNIDIKANETIKKILDAASHLFSKKGYDATSVDEISTEANVNKALIYYYFESKRKLLNFLFDEFTKNIVPEIIKKATSFRSFGIDAYRQIIRIILDDIYKYSDIINVLFIQGMGKKDDFDILIDKFTMIVSYANKEIEKYNLKILEDEKSIYKILLTIFMPLINFAFLNKEEKIKDKDDFINFFIESTYPFAIKFVEKN
ncbi:MAG: TetR/AcrR family transcriptional regulator [Spirochaetales bacterium]|jgi:AcrR family transcriptional regulator|nr:TetR/AcrR family transcriptional regulator [Exilispira sp.]NMC67934.1 TetR/AcrR family transcriptional regulator [Spirochaetales bacterium]